MSKFSHEHHIHLAQSQLLELMKVFFKDRFSIILQIIPLPEDKLQRTHLSAKDDSRLITKFIVSPTDEKGWTTMWSEFDCGEDEELVCEISKRGKCSALYGHMNDQVDNWRWILFEEGNVKSENWYLGRQDDSEDIYIKTAFLNAGQVYHHFTFSDVVDWAWREILGSVEGFKVITILK